MFAHLSLSLCVLVPQDAFEAVRYLRLHGYQDVAKAGESPLMCWMRTNETLNFDWWMTSDRAATGPWFQGMQPFGMYPSLCGPIPIHLIGNFDVHNVVSKTAGNMGTPDNWEQQGIASQVAPGSGVRQ